jgi:hypothetical protein
MRAGGSFFRLQRHMADAEMLFQFFGRVKQRFIGRGAVRRDQMAGQRDLGRLSDQTCRSCSPLRPAGRARTSAPSPDRLRQQPHPDAPLNAARFSFQPVTRSSAERFVTPV